MGRISMATRDELIGALVTRYAAGKRKERGRILDEGIVTLTLDWRRGTKATMSRRS